MFWQIFNSLLAKRRLAKIFLKGADVAEESKDQFFRNQRFRALTVQLYLCRPVYLFFFFNKNRVPVQLLCKFSCNVPVQLLCPYIFFCCNHALMGSNSHGLVIFFEIKIVFTHKKFFVPAFKIYSKKSYRNIE